MERNAERERPSPLNGSSPGAAAPLHLFADYAMNWFEIYSKPNIETVTATTYKRQLTRHLLPAFDGLTVEDITTDHIQRLFNGMSETKATKDKAKMVLNQILDAAVEDGFIKKNPLKSKANPAKPLSPTAWSKCVS